MAAGLLVVTKVAEASHALAYRLHMPAHEESLVHQQTNQPTCDQVPLSLSPSLSWFWCGSDARGQQRSCWLQPLALVAAAAAAAAAA